MASTSPRDAAAKVFRKKDRDADKDAEDGSGEWRKSPSFAEREQEDGKGMAPRVELRRCATTAYTATGPCRLGRRYSCRSDDILVDLVL